MKIIKILGGLGNQMFQYALYVSLKQRFQNEIIKIDTSCFRGYNLHNGFELSNIFSLNASIASWKDLCKVAYPYPGYRWWQIGKYILPKRKTMCLEKLDATFDTSVLEKEGNRFFDGYWQNEKYFIEARESVLSAFTFPKIDDQQNLEALNKIKSGTTVSIHIRRGDYLKLPMYQGICDLEYYRRAIQYMEEKVHPQIYCIFSNDIDWCETHLKDLLIGKEVIFVDWNKGKNSFRDMQLMSYCNHNIIANSSFSWWGAWLNQHSDKIVIGPLKWLNIDSVSPVPSSWTKL